MSDSDLSSHELRMQNGFTTLVALGIVAVVLWVTHATIGIATVVRAIAAGVAAIGALYVAIWITGVVVTDVPRLAKRWFR